jgi:nitroreductase
MMRMIDLLRKRRSIRKFQDRPVEPEKVEILKEAILRGPTARNLRSWEFVFVDDQALMKKLAQVRGSSSAFLDGAPLGIVVLGKEETSDAWIEDASIAAFAAQLTATSIDLGSCWAHIRLRDHSPDQTAEEYVRELLGIPKEYKVLCILAVGYPAEEKKGVPKDELPYGKIHENRF